jgi:adenosylcobinamide-GDP ribazoletransferase
MNTQRRLLIVAPRFTPLWGVLIGAAGGGIYWLSAQLWPTSIAVILSMLATHLLSARMDGDPAADDAAPSPNRELVGMVFAVLVKYNALMALSAASLPFALPSNLALGWIMIAGHAASRALIVSVTASPEGLAPPLTPTDTPKSTPPPAPAPASHVDLGVALVLGFAPAAFIGIPGLIGLVAAIAARFAVLAYLRRRGRAASADRELKMTLQSTEVCFYLGALAAWTYI